MHIKCIQVYIVYIVTWYFRTRVTSYQCPLFSSFLLPHFYVAMVIYILRFMFLIIHFHNYCIKRHLRIKTKIIVATKGQRRSYDRYDHLKSSLIESHTRYLNSVHYLNGLIFRQFEKNRLSRNLRRKCTDWNISKFRKPIRWEQLTEIRVVDVKSNRGCVQSNYI